MPCSDVAKTGFVCVHAGNSNKFCQNVYLNCLHVGEERGVSMGCCKDNVFVQSFSVCIFDKGHHVWQRSRVSAFIHTGPFIEEGTVLVRKLYLNLRFLIAN